MGAVEVYSVVFFRRGNRRRRKPSSAAVSVQPRVTTFSEAICEWPDWRPTSTLADCEPLSAITDRASMTHRASGSWVWPADDGDYGVNGMLGELVIWALGFGLSRRGFRAEMHRRFPAAVHALHGV